MAKLLIFYLIAFVLTLSPFLSSVLGQERSNQSSDEQLAIQFMSQGEYDKAAALFEELYDQDQSPRIYNNYLTSLLRINDFRKAEKLVEQQINTQPGRIRFEVDKIYVAGLAGDNRKESRLIDRLIKDVELHPNTITDLANAFLFREYYDEALTVFYKGRDAFGMASPFNLQIAGIHSQRNSYELMMKEYVELAVADISYLEQVQGIIQDELNDDAEMLKYEAIRRVLLQGSQTNPVQTLYAEMLLWLSLQQKDFEMALRQAKALDRRFGQDGKLVMDVANLSFSNQNFAVAGDGFQHVKDGGDLNPYYPEATVGLLNVKFKLATENYLTNFSLLQDVEAEYVKSIDQLGISPQTVSLMRNLANLQAFFLNKPDSAIVLLGSVIDMPNVSNRIKGEIRIELADILVLKGDLWDAHLLYALVDKTFRDDPLAHEARYKNARLSFYMGEFNWAKAQLDVLKAATSRLMANDAMALSMLIQDHVDEEGNSEPLKMYARSQMHMFKNNYDKALTVVDSLVEMHPNHSIQENNLMTRSEIYLKEGLYSQADSVLSVLTEQFPEGLLASDALFKRARIYETLLKDPEKAMNLYQLLMTNYPGSMNAVTARNRFRYLRGDSDFDDNFFFQQTFRP